MKKEIELSEKFLATSAGWQVMKEARKIHSEGRVMLSEWKSPELRGQVRGSDHLFNCGLTFRSGFDIENHCSCRESRQWGKLCAHSIALGLEVLNPTRKQSDGSSEPEESRPSVTGSDANRADDEDEVVRITRMESHESAPVLELRLVFSSAMEISLGQGRLQVFIEATLDGGTPQPLDRIDRGQGYLLSMKDDRLLAFIENLAGEPVSVLRVTQEQLPGFLRVLTDHPRLSLGRKSRLTVSETPMNLPITASLLSDGQIELKIRPGFQAPLIVQGEAGFWGYRNATLAPLGLPAQSVAVLQGARRIPRQRVPGFILEDLPMLKQNPGFECGFDAKDFKFKTLTPTFQLNLEGGLARLKGNLKPVYRREILDDGGDWIMDKEDVLTYYSRDVGSEAAALSLLSGAGFRIQPTTGDLELEGQDQVLAFFAGLYPRIKDRWVVHLEERLETSADRKIERIRPVFESTPSGEQWLDLEIRYQSDSGTRYSSSEIQQFLLSGRKHRPLSGGKFLVMDTDAVEEFNTVLQDCSPEQTGGVYRLSSLQEEYLKSTVVENPGWTWRSSKTDPGAANEVSLPDKPNPGDLGKILRDYQSIGLQWLWNLRRRHACGVLADDMGLGKTLQTLALLQSVQPYRKGPWLVICPSSLVFNWASEVEKFLPKIRLGLYTGEKRNALLSNISETDLVITSYTVARLDLELLREIEFDTIVLDEAQHIKNRKTRNARSVKALRSLHRLVLSGTPMENSVLDLWSIFDFLMPGYLGRAEDFREHYEIPITRQQDRPAMQRLSRRLRPYLLRRKKSEVAGELPSRLDHVAWCEMTAQQRALYQQILETTRKEVFGGGASKDEKRGRMMVLTALLRLRQVCCDPSLLPLPDVESISGSGKLNVFEEILQESLNGGHRMLVFSQFTSMLDTLGRWLEDQSIAFTRLDGNTRNRKLVVDGFQSSDSIPVFLISLKAGGTGLNLTAADTVVHFDPWWNPAVEEQATDRAHRIGQTRIVNNYKLITRDSVEEKILRLQQRKRDMIRMTFSDESGLADNLTWDEIEGLLQ